MRVFRVLSFQSYIGEFNLSRFFIETVETPQGGDFYRILLMLKNGVFTTCLYSLEAGFISQNTLYIILNPLISIIRTVRSSGADWNHNPKGANFVKVWKGCVRFCWVNSWQIEWQGTIRTLVDTILHPSLALWNLGNGSKFCIFW